MTSVLLGLACSSATAAETLALAWTAESDQLSSQLGSDVASAGDVNGDGFDDLVVGEPGYANPSGFEGRALVYLGSMSGLEVSPSWTVESNNLGAQFGANFGLAVASAGDVNGDGFDDVLVGANGYSNPELTEGAAFLYLGSPTGLELTPAWNVEGDQEDAWVGAFLSSAGDVNGDGYDDVLVGAPNWDNTELNEGRAFLYLGSATGLDTVAAWTADSHQAFADFGRVRSAGDVNGDGYDDVLVGAGTYDGAAVDTGKAYLYLGSALGLDTVESWTAEGDIVRTYFGDDLGPAGDVNADGFADVAVGAQGRNTVLVYHGSAMGLDAVPSLIIESIQRAAEFGRSVSTAGDVNGDGFSDLVVGAPDRKTSVGIDAGSAHVFLGGAPGLELVPVWTVEGESGGAFLGRSVASAGDINGDGFDDVVVGADSTPTASGGTGIAYLYEGSCGEACASTPVVTEANPGIAGQKNAWEITDAPAGVDVNWLWSPSTGATPVHGCVGVELGIKSPNQLGTSITDASGTARLVVQIPAGASGKTMLVQAVLPATCAVSNVSATGF